MSHSCSLPGSACHTAVGALFDELSSPTAGQQLLVSVDSLVDGVHFNAHTPLDALGYKCVAVNLSDMAAMGATPLALQCAWGDPADDSAWHGPLLAAIARAAESVAKPVSFGRLHTPQRQITIQILGTVPHGEALTRSGARSGDRLWVSGTLGDAGAGLALQQGSLQIDSTVDARYLRDRLNRPTARLELGQALRGIATAAIDISDGIAGDALHIVEQSRVGLRLFTHRLPISEALSRTVARTRALEFALSAGEDYELAFCVPPNLEEKVLRVAQRCQTPVHCIGEVVTGDALMLLDEEAQPIAAPRAFDHFSGQHNGKIQPS